MKIVKVRNHLMFNSNNPNGIHYYGFFWNRQYRRYNAIQLTHIAKVDNIRYNQADNGIIKNVRIKKLDKYADSGITKKNYINNVYGNLLHPNMGIVVVNKVSGSTAKKIKNFATDNYSRGRKLP